MKKLTALILIAVMLLSLAACGSKAPSAKSLAGSWAAEWDMSDTLEKIFLENVSALGVDIDSLPADSKVDFRVPCTLDINSDGTYRLDLPQDALEKAFDQFAASLENVMRVMVEQMFTQEAEAAGMTLDELYAQLGCKNMDELIEMSTGSSLRSLIDELIAGTFKEQNFNISEEGKFTVDGLNVYLTSSSGAKTTMGYSKDSDVLVTTETINDFGEVTFRFTRK